MSNHPSDICSGVPTFRNPYFDAIQSNDHLCKLFRAYETIGTSLKLTKSHDAPVALFDRKELKKERLRLRDEIETILASQSG